MIKPTIFSDNKIPKQKNSLFLYCSNLYWFCIKIEWRKLSSSVFGAVQIQTNKQKRTIDFIEAELEESSDEEFKL